jgi:hypothetical protein
MLSINYRLHLGLGKVRYISEHMRLLLLAGESKGSVLTIHTPEGIWEMSPTDDIEMGCENFYNERAINGGIYRPTLSDECSD